MTTSVVEKIRKQNAERALRSPFNYCDRWCARCNVTQLCRVYQEELQEKLNQLVDGKIPESMECVMESIKKSTRRAIAKIRALAKEEGVDLKSDPFDEEEIKLARIRSGNLKRHLLSRLAYAFCGEANSFLKRHYYRKSQDTSEEYVSDYQILEWYHTLLPPKVSRLLQSFYDYNEWQDQTIREEALGDAIAQMDICRKAIVLSRAACDQLTLPHPTELVPFAKMRTFLNEMMREFEALEAQIDKKK